MRETSRSVNTFGRIALLAETFAPAGIKSVKRTQGSTCLEVEKRVDLPAAQHLANKSTLLCEEWQFVKRHSRKVYEACRNLNGPNQNPPER